MAPKLKKKSLLTCHRNVVCVSVCVEFGQHLLTTTLRVQIEHGHLQFKHFSTGLMTNL